QLYMNILDMEDTERYHTFLDGLKPQIQLELKKMEIDTNNPDELMDEAVKMDDILFQATSKMNRTTKPTNQSTHRSNFKNKQINTVQTNTDEKRDIVCFNCNKKGHYAKDCRSKPANKKPEKTKQTFSEAKRAAAKEQRTTSINSIEKAVMHLEDAQGPTTPHQ